MASGPIFCPQAHTTLPHVTSAKSKLQQILFLASSAHGAGVFRPSLLMEAAALSSRPLRTVVGLNSTVADAWFIGFGVAAWLCMVAASSASSELEAASSHEVRAHCSGGGGYLLAQGLAKYDGLVGRALLSRRRRLGQRVGCSSWSRSLGVCHSHTDIVRVCCRCAAHA